MTRTPRPGDTWPIPTRPFPPGVRRSGWSALAAVGTALLLTLTGCMSDAAAPSGAGPTTTVTADGDTEAVTSTVATTETVISGVTEAATVTESSTVTESRMETGTVTTASTVTEASTVTQAVTSTEKATVTEQATTTAEVTTTAKATTTAKVTTTEKVTAPADTDLTEVNSTSGALVFFTPSRNIACSLADGGARCDLADRSYADPTGDPACDVGRRGNALEVTGQEPSRFPCINDTILTTAAPILPYGSTATLDGVSCASAKDGVTCTVSSSGHGFRVAEASYDQF